MASKQGVGTALCAVLVVAAVIAGSFWLESSIGQDDKIAPSNRLPPVSTASAHSP